MPTTNRPPQPHNHSLLDRLSDELSPAAQALLGVVETAGRTAAELHTSRAHGREDAAWLGLQGILRRSVPAEYLTPDVLDAARRTHHDAYMAAIGPWAPGMEATR